MTPPSPTPRVGHGRWLPMGPLTLRGQLQFLALAPLILVMPLLGLLLGWGTVAFDRLLITKVRADLAVAQGYFERVQAGVGQSAEAVAGSQFLHRALFLEHAGRAQLHRLLEENRARHGLDFLALKDAQGRDALSDPAGMAAAPGPVRPPGPLPPTASLRVLPIEELAGLAPPLRERVPVPLVPTRNAAPSDRQSEDRALVLLAEAPILDASGRLVGTVQAGLLLNRNLALIDHINDIVYPEGSLPFGSQGTATLFLDDVRISTNVRLFGGVDADRAIGTRVSQEVRTAVLDQGGTWLQRAFVVDDWYVSAYQPLQDATGQRVGMLYVGYSERPFSWLKRSMLAGIVLIFTVAMLLFSRVSLKAARRIFQPIERMTATMAQVEGGQAGARVGPLTRRDELGKLAGHLDHLLDVLDANTRALRQWNAELDAKVTERTRDLTQAQRQLAHAERLATIGQLTASIAHEVNNPIAVIQGNLDLARELMGPEAVRAGQAELALIDQQIERIRRIVDQLLRHARPAEYADPVETDDLAALIESSLRLVAHQLAQGTVQVERRLLAQRRPAVHRHEFQQVLVNLLANALHAMGGEGQLGLTTRDRGAAEVEIEVSDTGPGLGADLLDELFQPFVTRRPDGNGLGLWISRSIVEACGGRLLAGNRSDGGRGAVFTVILPAGLNRCEDRGP